MRILVFGEILWDVFPDKKCIGGAALNFAAHASLFGEETSFLSCAGIDDLGNEAVDYAAGLGMDTSLIGRSELPTGQSIVTLDAQKIPSYRILEPVAYDEIRIPEQGLDSCYDVLYYGTLSIRNETSYVTLTSILQDCHFGEIFCDINLRAPFYSEKTVELCLSHATILKVSREELVPLLSMIAPDTPNRTVKEAAALLSGKYPNIRTLIITLDEEGAYAYRPATAEELTVPACRVETVSTVGAGDGFSAAFLHRYLRGDSLDSSLRFANRFAAYVVTHVEAVPSHDGFSEEVL